MSTGDFNPQTVGSDKDPVAKACRQEFRRSSRRPGLCSSDLEQACSLSLAPKFPDVLPDETACRPRSNIHDSGDHSEADADQLREASRSCDGSTEVRDQDNRTEGESTGDMSGVDACREGQDHPSVPSPTGN